MRKALVLELKNSYAVVSELGNYLRVVQKEGMEIGRTILFTEDDIVLNSKKSVNRWRQRLVPVMAAFVLVFVLAGGFYNNNYMVYSAVTVDINPSVELLLNRKEHVIKVVALNEDAETLNLKELKGLSVTVAVNEIIDDAKVKGFIQTEEKSYVVLTSVPLRATSEAVQTSLQHALREQVAKANIDENLTVAVTESTEALLEEAKEEAIPLAVVNMKNHMDISEVDSVRELFANEENHKLFQIDGQIYEVRHQNRERIIDEEPLVVDPEKTYREEYVERNRINYQLNMGSNQNSDETTGGNGENQHLDDVDVGNSNQNYDKGNNKGNEGDVINDGDMDDSVNDDLDKGKGNEEDVDNGNDDQGSDVDNGNDDQGGDDDSGNNGQQSDGGTNGGGNSGGSSSGGGK